LGGVQRGKKKQTRKQGGGRKKKKFHPKQGKRKGTTSLRTGAAMLGKKEKNMKDRRNNKTKNQISEKK